MLNTYGTGTLDILGKLYAARPLPRLSPNLVQFRAGLPSRLQLGNLLSMLPPTLRVLQLHLIAGFIAFDAIDNILRHL